MFFFFLEMNNFCVVAARRVRIFETQNKSIDQCSLVLVTKCISIGLFQASSSDGKFCSTQKNCTL